MSGVYESLKIKVQGTMRRGKTQSGPQPEGSTDPANSEDQFDNLERVLADVGGRLKAAVREREAVLVHRAVQAEQVVEGLRVEVGTLQAKLKELEETVRKKDLAQKKIEEDLHGVIRDLQNDAKTKQEVLVSRAKEVNELKSKVDGQVKQLIELDAALNNAKMEAARQAKRANDASLNSQSTISAIESQLRDVQQRVREKESMIKGLEQNLAAKIQEFESELRRKQELLSAKDARIDNLETQLQFLTKGLGEMSAFFRRAETLVSRGEQSVSQAAPTHAVSGNGEKEKPVAARPSVQDATPAGRDSRKGIVSADVIDSITAELADVAGVMKPFALIIVRNHMAALGESMENFPRMRLPELLESLAKEISDENMKIHFRQRLSQNAQILGESSLLS
jgi:chromosome segregation ATPase